MTPVLSIIVVSRDLWPMTLKSLEGLIFTLEDPWELIFINNGSTDETKEAFEQVAQTWKWHNFEGYKAHHYKRGVGLAAAWNKGYSMIDSSQYVMIANNDIYYHQGGWWTKMRQMLDAGMHLVGIQEMTWYRFRFVEGCLFAAKSSTFEVLASGGRLFDTQFKLSCEDVDLSERALRAGYRIGQVVGLQPEYLVHLGHKTLEHFASEDLHPKMHEARRRLCKKWGYPPQVED